MSPFSPGYVSQLPKARKPQERRPVIVPIERDIHARIGDKQAPKSDRIKRGNSFI
jgi:hypothetical protein